MRILTLAKRIEILTGQARFFLPNPPTLKADGRADLFVLCSIAALFQIVLVGRAALI